MDASRFSTSKWDHVIHTVGTDQKVIAMTFDDGPDMEFTPKVLDILHQYRIKANFFCIGSHVQKFPDIARRMVNEGHLVANHTWDHPHLTQISSTELRSQVEQTSDVISECIGQRPRYVRPPYGDIDDRVAQEFRNLGYDVVLWSVDSVDWSGISGPEITSNVIPNIVSGAILLLHSAGNVAGTVDALPYLIEVIQKMGYQFVKLDEILAETPE